MLYRILLLAALLAASEMNLPTKQADLPAGKVLLAMSGSRLMVMLKIAQVYQTPLGLVLDDKRSLCQAEVHFSGSGQSVEASLRQLTSDTAYVLSRNEYGYVLAPKQVNQHLNEVMAYQIRWFPAGHESLASAGARLAGYILIGTEGASGFASDVLSNSSTQKLDVPESRRTSFETVASKIATLGAGAVWILELDRTVKEGTIGSARFHFVSLQDIDSDLTCR